MSKRKFSWLVVEQTYRSAVIKAETNKEAIDLFNNMAYYGSEKQKQALEDSTSVDVEAHEYDCPSPKRKRK